MTEKKYHAALISLGSVSSKMTAKAMRKHFKKVDELQIKEIEIVLGQENPVLYQGKTIANYDCIFVKGSFRYAAVARSITSLLYDSAYMPTEPGSFTIVHDKILTHIRLQSRSVPMPKTYLTATPSAAKELLKNLNYPIITKFPQGTQGKGVMFADSFAAASSLLDALESLKQPFLIQEYVETSGVDIRAFVVGDVVVAAMKRKAAKGEKRSNIHAGGVAESFEMSPSMKQVAVNTARAIGADICGVDILESVKGPVVIEANISPGLQGITESTGKDIAGSIAKYLFERTKEFRESGENPDAQDLLDELETGTSDKESSIKTLVGPLDFRADRILLPKVAVSSSGIKEDDECTVIFEDGKIEIKKGL
jgi:ribosomal protein S6--L-glutamate ligase